MRVFSWVMRVFRRVIKVIKVGINSGAQNIIKKE